MAKASLSDVVKYCDRRLRIAEIKDFTQWHRLQVKQRARHAHCRHCGCQPGHGKARHRGARGFVDCASWLVLEPDASGGTGNGANCSACWSNMTWPFMEQRAPAARLPSAPRQQRRALRVAGFQDSQTVSLRTGATPWRPLDCQDFARGTFASIAKDIGARAVVGAGRAGGMPGNRRGIGGRRQFPKPRRPRAAIRN